ncbi:hypothetical protein RKT74_05510 [Leclercia pneumoniae]|uniref:hypothetical protein n=1 Tax=Leclercia TaxID=83654 RepID=UPI00062C4696|nr:hypothetical protein [Leclercia pneumoniae]KKY90600.1 hypothetical protein OA46_00545 [Enterobacter cloacae]MBS0851586.1 hypothetical protein [Enterobacter sp. JGM127]MCV2510927.1 hypothetical protein [Leclercia pneumoniae]WNN82272.1 hypothetical protein RKT74_05510 [Leclercia pneumoniae]
MKLNLYWAVPLAILFIGPIFSLQFPSTPELTSPRFLFLYGSMLLAACALIVFSLNGRLPLPVWTTSLVMLIVLIGSPTVKMLFEN